MNPTNFIQQRLESLKTPEGRVSEGESVEDAIYRYVLSKKFRKYAINPLEYTEHIRSAINLAVSKNEPIKFTLVFGI